MKLTVEIFFTLVLAIPDAWFMLYVILHQDSLSFPLICPDWNADEEILLLEVHFSFICFIYFLAVGF